MYHLHRCWGHTVLYSTYLWKSIQIHPKREPPVVRSSTLAARLVQHQPRVGLGPGQESPCPWPPAHFREPPLSTWDPGFPTQGTPVLLASLMEPLPLTHLPRSPVLWSVYFRPKNWQGCAQGVRMEYGCSGWGVCPHTFKALGAWYRAGVWSGQTWVGAEDWPFLPKNY